MPSLVRNGLAFWMFPQLTYDLELRPIEIEVGRGGVKAKLDVQTWRGQRHPDGGCPETRKRSA
jgi:hypothetical protein